MKKLIILWLLISTCTVSNGQTIHGKILDKKTKGEVPFASIYFNGTFVGTTSDANGKFELAIAQNISMPLTISAIGYFSASIANFYTTDSIKVYLEPKVYELKGAEVNAKSLEKQRRRNLALFKDEFLGTTDNAQQCVIINERDITFNYGSDDDTLRAYALKPILIANMALGYKVTYYLDKFEYYRRKGATFFSGNIIFLEDVTNDQTKLLCYEKRKITYLGSRMHFFRMLWADNLKHSGFEITRATYENLKYKDIVIQDDNGNKFLKYPENLRVAYTINTSFVYFLKKNVYFDKVGYFDPSGINWVGYMAQQRVADWLPYEYSVE